jgi:hypothetical protein
MRLANGVLYLEYAGYAVHHPWLKDGRRKIYDFSGGTIP